MAHTEIVGKDLLLESFGYNFRHKVVRLSQNEIGKIKEVIVILDKAADLWAKSENNQDASDNEYRRAELELRGTIDFWA